MKRKEAPHGAIKDAKKPKVAELRKSRLDKAAEEDDFEGFDGEDTVEVENAKGHTSVKQLNGPKKQYAGAKAFQLDTSSAEAHAKQRALAKERKASKPHADVTARSKRIWERLRRKSHVPANERKELVAELFSIINGRVRDFVFKHDSVRVIQCALKYANHEQRRMILQELRGDIRTLVESRYGKFLVAKMIVEGNQEIKDIIMPEFYGHIKRLINHPEASWIVDDIYRQVATPKQKAIMLREWYGSEYALSHRNPGVLGISASSGLEDTAELLHILKINPEKRKPILEFLYQMINSLIQKKMTGFTMLHDAMLQYFLALHPNTDEHAEFLEVLKGDIETKVEAEAANSIGGGGDLFRNLAFTKSGSRLVCLAIAWGSAKDRKIILKCFKDNVALMAWDPHAKMVLLVGLDVTDDTKMTGKTILHELLGQNIDDETQRLDHLEELVTNQQGRVPILHQLVGSTKWLMNDQEKAVLEEVLQIRKNTSKKAPELRRKALLEFLAPPLLDLVTKRASSLARSSFGCQLMTEVLLEANSEQTRTAKEEAKKAVAALAQGDPMAEGHIALNAAAARMLKTLVLGGTFDMTTKTTKLAEPRLDFAATLYPFIEPHIVRWASGPSAFLVVALLEGEDVSKELKSRVITTLQSGKECIKEAAASDPAPKAVATEGKLSEKKGKGSIRKGNPGAKILLEKFLA